jgi:hypothetical protein
MAKPATKKDLIAESQKEYQDLQKFLAGLSPEEMLQPALGEWSPKDVLAHLLEWQNMFFGWYEAGLRGETPALPAEGYKWNQLPALNQAIYERYRDASLSEIENQFRKSHEKTMQLVDELSNEGLFERGYHSWTTQHSLATFINANTGSHYRWARTDMRKELNRRKKAGVG